MSDVKISSKKIYKIKSVFLYGSGRRYFKI